MRTMEGPASPWTHWPVWLSWLQTIMVFSVTLVVPPEEAGSAPEAMLCVAAYLANVVIATVLLVVYLRRRTPASTAVTSLCFFMGPAWLLAAELPAWVVLFFCVLPSYTFVRARLEMQRADQVL